MSLSNSTMEESSEPYLYGTMPTVLCCMCGVEIQHNAANMCVSCLRSQHDVCEGIKSQLTIHNCRTCGRWLAPPWQTMALESKELMAMCLRKTPGLNKVKLVDSVWIWTEPHSMRLKLKLTVQREVVRNAVLQQACVVEYVIRNQQCKSCEAAFAQGAWHGIVQVRQRVGHKRTFYYLEQLLLKTRAHDECIKIVAFADGLDFYFPERQHGVRFVDFLSNTVPVEVKYARKLVSADQKSNTANYKHNFAVEIAPICKDDLVILPRKLAMNLSNISSVVLVKGVAAGIHVLDPFTCERQEVSSEKYWRHQFTPVMTFKDLTRFVVLSVDPIYVAEDRPSAKRRTKASRMQLAECVVVREKDLGVNSDAPEFTVTTHLGNVLKEGDIVLGYDLTMASWTHDQEVLDQLVHKASLPDVILVRKFYDTKGDRSWYVNKIDDVEVAGGASSSTSRRGAGASNSAMEAEEEGEDYEAFMQEIEADKEFRSQMKIFSKAGAKAAANPKSTTVSELDDEFIRLEELISEVRIDRGIEDTAAQDKTTSPSLSRNAAPIQGEARLLSAVDAASSPDIAKTLYNSKPASDNSNVPASATFDEANFDPESFKFT